MNGGFFQGFGGEVLAGLEGLGSGATWSASVETRLRGIGLCIAMMVELYGRIGRHKNEKARCFAKRHHSADYP